jgi:hypothetical protein
MAPRGIYRTETRESVAEYALVEYGVGSSLGEIPRASYEADGYEPPFESLPTTKPTRRNLRTSIVHIAMPSFCSSVGWNHPRQTRRHFAHNATGR